MVGGLLDPADLVCRASRRHVGSLASRSFTPAESLAYEVLVANPLAVVLADVVSDELTGRSVLDVGCGGGTIARVIARGGRQVVGVDAAASQVARFNRHAVTDAVTATRAPAEELPFGDGRFDSSYSTCAYKHWTDQVGGLREMSRVTRSGGRVVVVELDGGSDAERFSHFASRSRVPSALKGLYIWYTMRAAIAIAPTRDSLYDAMVGAGLCDVHVERLGNQPFLVATARTSN